MKILNGTISISCGHNSIDDSRTVSITVTDGTSHAHVIDVELSAEDFAVGLFGLAERPCRFELNDSGVVGLTAENKTVEVVFPKNLSWYGHPAAIAQATVSANEALAPYEVDGWRARRGSGADYRNHHRLVKGNVLYGTGKHKVPGDTFKVSLFRFVNPTTGQPWEPKPEL